MSGGDTRQEVTSLAESRRSTVCCTLARMHACTATSYIAGVGWFARNARSHDGYRRRRTAFSPHLAVYELVGRQTLSSVDHSRRGMLPASLPEI